MEHIRYYDKYGLILKPYDIVLYKFKGSGKIPWKGIIIKDFDGKLKISNLADPDDYKKLNECYDIIFVGGLEWLSKNLNFQRRMLLKEVNDEKH